jgi:hypothetical protein
MVAIAASFADTFSGRVDEVLYDVCEELQLSESRYKEAEKRYGAVGAVLESPGSPFRLERPAIYAQGSMALGTTVKPVVGPHDLDFVVELSRNYTQVNPMGLLLELYRFLKEHGVYGSMTTLKNRCVRIEYANEFYMDILPACRNGDAGDGRVKVPDRKVQGWKDSNPSGYTRGFYDACRYHLLEGRVMAKAEPIPTQRAASEKYVLQLAVQLVKRWRDLHYTGREDVAPISVVLTALAATLYRGEGSVSQALSNVLAGIVAAIQHAESLGKRLVVLNPSNTAEDLSERWEEPDGSYQAFTEGVRHFERRWRSLLAGGGDVSVGLLELFGEPVKAAVIKQARRLQEDRRAGKLAVTSGGTITGAATGSRLIRPNTFYGEE